MPPEPTLALTVAQTVTLTLPRDVAALLAILALGGLYWYVIGIRDWVGELVQRGVRTWN